MQVRALQTYRKVYDPEEGMYYCECLSHHTLAPDADA